MKTIVCFGDSNTWGYDPANTSDGPRKRFGVHDRWAGVLRDLLGAGYWVIEEGLNGRTTVMDDPIEGGTKNGRLYLAPCLDTHAPIDLITIMLGSNDLKKRFSLPASDIARGVKILVETVLKSDAGPNQGAPRVLLMAPPPLAELTGTRFADMFEDALEKSHQLAEEYAMVAKDCGVDFLNAGAYVTSSPIDAIHYGVEEHRKLGEAVAAKVQAILG